MKLNSAKSITYMFMQQSRYIDKKGEESESNLFKIKGFKILEFIFQRIYLVIPLSK